MQFLPRIAGVCLLLTLSCAVMAQKAQRTLYARVRTGQIAVDGRLDEEAWRMAPVATAFTQNAPRPGEPSVARTTVSILYDDDAVYVGAMLYEQDRDSIMRQLTPRDDFENSATDAFGVTFDTYFDRQNATQFVVTAAGVQADGIVKFDAVDRSWNAAWFSRVHISDSGWSVEMKIPYSALRFPKKDMQLWGTNFLRVIRRYREQSHWNFVNPRVQNVIGQSGRLDSIHDIKAPLRLALLPYMSTYGQNYAGSNTGSLNGGLDIKYGINESFTLDMTLVPDFGQTRFDDKVLNLSAIEVRYDERRYFFTEGVDLFNKNDLFYSRRVGGTPVQAWLPAQTLSATEQVSENPANTRLYNAFKVSGRNKARMGIGLFNAVSAPAWATVRDTVTGAERKVETSPLTNYSVLVIDQALKNNSYLSFVNTNVTRAGAVYDADVSALLFRFANKANRYGANGSAEVSQRFDGGATDAGYRALLNFGKLSGNYTWTLNSKLITDRFNPNDLGYLDRNNIFSLLYYNIYNTYVPFGRINSTYNKIGMEYYRSYAPDAFMKSAIHGNHVVTFTSFHTIGAYWDAQPGVMYDYLEPRTPGRFYRLPANNMTGGFVSSDYRRRFALDVEASKRWFGASPRQVFYWSVSPRYRFSDKLSAIYSFWTEDKANDVGFVSRVDDSVFLGTRKLHTMVNSLTTAYIFNRTMSLKLDARHYWSQADYSAYGLLEADGNLSNSTSYSNSHNVNYNSFNVFMNFIWQFRPGSEMSVVYQNSIYSSGSALAPDYTTDLRQTVQAPQSNSLSLKIIYFLDYQTMSRVFQRQKEVHG